MGRARVVPSSQSRPSRGSRRLTPLERSVGVIRPPERPYIHLAEDDTLRAMAKPKSTSHAPTVFYAWQDTTPGHTNRYFIKKALDRAIKRVAQGDPAYAMLRYDETTRGMPGSPMIVDAILGKIDVCEVFVADISIISQTAEGERRVPNPNVMFETGWAAARVGWDRTILVFNAATGTIEGDVPFDVRGRRLLRYNLPADGSGDAASVSRGLEDALYGALGAALASPPPLRQGPRPKRGALSPELQRDRDRAALHRLLGTLDTQWVDRYLLALSDERILRHADVHYLSFTGTAREARFLLFDRQTERTIREFVEAWDRVYEATRFGDAYPGESSARFRPEVFDLGGKSAAEVHRELAAAAGDMHERLHAMLKRLHRAFPELDLQESDERTRKAIEALLI
jgi:hypothetical protein